jgi:putative addiction module component (TIGR02574 family)
MTPADRLLAEALRLPEAERSALAASLIASLEATADPDADTAWGEEIQRRMEELDSGLVRPIPWTEARRLIVEDTDNSSES